MNQQTVSPDSIPRTLEACAALKPSQRFRLMHQIGAFADQDAKKRYGAAANEQQAQVLLEALGAYDAAGGGGNGAAPQTQMPAAGTPQMPAGQPQMAPPQQMPGMPQGQMAPPQPAAAQPQMPPMAAPPQAQMPGVAAQQAAPPPTMAAPPQMAPQPPQAAPGPPQVAAPPQMPMAQPPQPQAAPAPLPQMPGMPGSQMPQMPQAAPGPPQAAVGDTRDPAPPQQPQTPQGALPRAAAAVAPQNDGGSASSTILKTLAKNNEQIIAGLSQLGEVAVGNNEALQSIHAAVLGNSRMLAVLIVMLGNFVEKAMQTPKQNLVPEWATALNGGEVEAILRELSQPQGKG